MSENSTAIEEWRPVVGSGNTHEVSNLGRVRSVERWSTDTRGRTRKIPQRILRGYSSSHGYRQAIGRYVHHMVAEAFIGPRPDGSLVCHRDDVKTNNQVSNLYYGNMAENGDDCVRNGLNVWSNKTHCPSGHEYAGHNVVWTTRGNGKQFRRCRACLNADRRRGRQRRKQERAHAVL